MESFDNIPINHPFKSIRIIRYKEFSGSLNMSLDHYFSSELQKTKVPVLRFYGWNPYCLSLGRHQDSGNILIKKLNSDGYQVVRRPTGGSAILHSEELTYSIVVPLHQITHHKLYDIIHIILGKALIRQGYNVTLHDEVDNYNYLKKGDATFACFNRSAYREIKYDDRKLVGSAQKVYKNTILQHGSILIGQKQREIVNYLDEDDENKQKTLAYLNSKSVSLNEISKLKIDAWHLSEGIIDEFKLSGIKIVGDENLTSVEINEAKKYINIFKL